MRRRTAGSGFETTPIASYSLPDLETTAGIGAFLQLRDVVANDIVSHATPLVSVDAPAGRSVGPDSYHFYLQARARVLENFCEGGRAVELLRQALAIDESFAEAWQLLGEVYYNHAWACGRGHAILAKARAALERAAELRPLWIEPKLLKSTLLVEIGEAEQGYEEALKLDRAFPDHPFVLELQSYALRYAGFVSRSVELLERSRELDPLLMSNGPTGESPAPYLYALDLASFEAALPANPSSYHRFYRSLALLLGGDLEEADRLASLAYRSSPEDVFGQLSRALTLTLNEDSEGARVAIDNLSRQRRDLGARDGEITYKQAQLLAFAGDLSGSLRELENAVDDGFFCVRCFETDPLLKDLRQLERFRELLARASARHTAFASRFDLEPELARQRQAQLGL